MGIFVNVKEDRDIYSIICDTISELSSDSETTVTNIKTDILAGNKLVKGQIFMLSSTANTHSHGTVPAIVTKVTQKTVSSYEYELLVLVGDLTEYKANKWVLTSDKLPDAVKLDVDMTTVIEDIKLTMLGRTSILNMKRELGIRHLFELKIADDKFISYL